MHPMLLFMKYKTQTTKQSNANKYKGKVIPLQAWSGLEGG
jgi:hypothetical protein